VVLREKRRLSARVSGCGISLQLNAEHVPCPVTLAPDHFAVQVEATIGPMRGKEQRDRATVLKPVFG
jgi:hypothetical protein